MKVAKIGGKKKKLAQAARGRGRKQRQKRRGRVSSFSRTSRLPLRREVVQRAKGTQEKTAQKENK